MLEKMALYFGLFGGAGVIAQTSVPIDSTLAERLGAAGAVVVILLIVLRWASVQIQKKDDRIESVTQAHLASQKDNAQMVYTALLANTTSNQRVERAVTENTTELKELRMHLSRTTKRHHADDGT